MRHKKGWMKMKLGNRYLAIALAVMLALTSMVSLGTVTVSADDVHVFYVSTTGNDSNNGSIDAPWKTLLFASRHVSAGDTVYVRGGTYPDDSIWSYATGTETSPITMKAYQNEVPVITGSGMYSQIIHFQADTKYWLLEGITTDNTSGTTPVYIADTNNITLRNCSFKNNAGNASTIMQLNTSSYITIEGCTFDTTGGDLIGGDGEGDGIYINGSNHSLILNNYFTRCGHYAMDLKDNNDAGVTTSFNNIIRNNLIEQHWSGGIGLIFKAHNNVVENNRIYYVGEGCTYPKTGIQLAADKNIIRNNIIGWASNGGPATVGNISNPISILSYRLNGCDQNASDNRVYNNVTYKNGGKSLMVSEKHATVITGNKVLNNIFYHDKVGGTKEDWWPAGNWSMLVETYHSTTYQDWQTGFPRKNYFNNNLWMYADAQGDHPGIKLFYFDGGQDGGKAWDKTLSEIQASYPTYFFGNKEQNPGFVNADNGDFRLASNSPAIDAGAHLTKTVLSGTNTTTVKVDDALFFTDGYGIAQGDQVKIGNNPLVTITAIDYDTNTLTVSAPVTFSMGAAVDLPYNGTAPDLGASEYYANSTPMPSLVPTSTSVPTSTPAPTPTAAPFAAQKWYQNFESSNGFSAGTTASVALDSGSANAGGSKSVKMTANEDGKPATNYVAITPQAGESIDITAYSYLSFYVKDTQGNNTTMVTLVDSNGKTWTGWAVDSSVQNAWTKINLDLNAAEKSYGAMDIAKSNIKEIRLGEWNTGTYYFDDIYFAQLANDSIPSFSTSLPTATPIATPTATPTLKDTIAPKAPAVNTIDDNDKAVTGKTEAGALVTVKKGSIILNKGYASTNGSYSIKIASQKAGTVLYVTAKDAAGNLSIATKVTVKDGTPPSAPVVNVVKSSAKIVTGKAEAGALITVKRGNTVLNKGYANTKGSFLITIAPQKKGTVLYITAKDKAGNISTARKVVVIK
jgi:hypothetical protein